MEPRRFVFISRRFVENKKECREHFLEQEKCLKAMMSAIENAGCVAIEAANPGQREDRYYDLQVYKAVFSRLWASDACAVLALNEDGSGRLSMSIAHEIGFFAGRNRPLKVFVTAARDKDPVFGNIVGMNRIAYADGDAGFVETEQVSLYQKVRMWAASLANE